MTTFTDPLPADPSSPLANRSLRARILTDLQTQGVRLATESGVPARQGGAGPTDHKALSLLGETIMVPLYHPATEHSPYRVGPPNGLGEAMLFRGDQRITTVTFPREPFFYQLKTVEGIPYRKIATLHSQDVLATTVLQQCVRYSNRKTRCQFCAIGESLRAGQTIARKTPEQLAEVALAAQMYDGVQHLVMTTGTPPEADRGAGVLADCAAAVKESTGMPLQAQCEPPDDFQWFDRLRAAGVDSLGMHLEAWQPEVRERIMPGKAEVSLDFYREAFAAAVPVFGRGQVSTYLLAGLGDSAGTLLRAAEELISLGVYPFIVPFVPVTGTPLARHPAPSTEFLRSVLEPVGRLLRDAGMTADTVKAGCARCGACSSLASFEKSGPAKPRAA